MLEGMDCHSFDVINFAVEGSDQVADFSTGSRVLVVCKKCGAYGVELWELFSDLNMYCIG
jgi:hypothetical protein